MILRVIVGETAAVSLAQFVRTNIRTKCVRPCLLACDSVASASRIVALIRLRHIY